jgi:hypothetical protein
MALIRIIHPDEYESRERRFKSTAFEPSSDGSGISVIESECAVAESGSLCAHAEIRYRSLIPSEPPLTFYLWTVAPLPDGCSAVHSDDDEDPCHRNIVGFSSNDKAKKFFKREHFKQIDGVKRTVGIARCGLERVDQPL